MKWNNQSPHSWVASFIHEFQRNNPFSNQTFAHLGVGVVKAGRFDVGKDGIRIHGVAPVEQKKTKREGDVLSRKNNLNLSKHVGLSFAVFMFFWGEFACKLSSKEDDTNTEYK